MEALSVVNVSKTFGGQRALDGVSLSIEPGEIRAVVGQNGCGKSTLIKILAGFHQPDPGGSVTVAGEPLIAGDGVASQDAGLRFVHQDLGLVGPLDTVDNLALGVGYASYKRKISWRSERQAATAALRALGYEIDVRLPVSRLSMSERTAVAIARATSKSGSEPKVLVLDEPTANLPTSEAERLYQLIRQVAERGLAVLFVSHHFDEVFELASTVTVLRDGRHIATRETAGLTEPELIELVVGGLMEEYSRKRLTPEVGPVVLDAADLSGRSVHGVSLQVRSGEIVGVAGITGSGREELGGLIFGGKPRSGQVSVGGQTLEPMRPDRSIALGVGFVPAERHANAAFLESSLRENVTLVDPGRHMRRLVIRKRGERSDVSAWLRQLDVRPPNAEFPMAALSGGNQQKVVLARWLRQEPKVLILDEPTQGVDVGAKADIHRLVDEAAAQGASVLVLSSDHEELAALCHRIVILRKGCIVEELAGDTLRSDRVTAGAIGRG